MTNRDLKIAIAHAKWSVEYDLALVSETAEWDGSIGMIETIANSISSGWIGRSRINITTAADEIRTLKASMAHLRQLSQEAIRQGIDPSSIPARSRNDYLGDL
jgi:hypothetical protein